jgi:tRNA1Val (adenine37-N6)-methyltransferase
MGNPYFRFKEFTVQHDRCGMKVTTEACLFGALVAARMQPTARHLLDMGAGTGLLSLMLAQQHPALEGTAVEIDAAAAAQAADNIAASPWPHRLQVVHADIRLFVPPVSYDLIISNPPFFTGNLQGPDARKNQALHNDGLPFADLSAFVARHLAPAGRCWILLPVYEFGVLEALLAARGLFLREQWTIRQTPGHAVFRYIGCFGREAGAVHREELSIRGTDQAYTPAFRELLQAYYLAL